MRSNWYILVMVLMVHALAGCYNSVHNRNKLMSEYTEQQMDSLSFYGTHHYTNNYNFLVDKDSLMLLSQQPEEILSELAIDTFSVYRHELLVVADIRIIPDDQVDSVWVQLATEQAKFGWVHESELLDSIVPDDPISRFINTFSNVHLILFLTFAVVVGAIFIGVRMTRKNVKMPFFNDIDTFYPTMLCITVAFSATFYATLQLFAPQMWAHFYFNPTLNPFSVPFPLNLFLASVWMLVILGLATIDDIRRHLQLGDALLYISFLAVFCALNYVVFSISTLYYVGYPILIIYIGMLLKRFLKFHYKPYLCGNCGSQLRRKGRCPYCGTMNL